jgi:hypothetical protein
MSTNYGALDYVILSNLTSLPLREIQMFPSVCFLPTEETGVREVLLSNLGQYTVNPNCGI